MEAIQYQPEFKEDWDCFVATAKNSIFQFSRDFIEYHEHFNPGKFKDASILLTNNSGIIGVFPANLKGDRVYSHSGLSFGGLIIKDLKLPEYLQAWDVLWRHYEKSLYIKRLAHIYHTSPADEDLYNFYLWNAKLVHCAPAAVIPLQKSCKVSSLRKRGAKKAEKAGVELSSGTEYFSSYWDILSSNLQARHNTHPVHSLEEILYLAQRFPVRLNVALYEGQVVAGILIFEYSQPHVQYIATTPQGRELGALDYLFLENISLYRSKGYTYYDFGISSENNGYYLNKGLNNQKQGFGGETIAYMHFLIGGRSC